MSRKTKLWIGCGIFGILILLASSLFAITFNDSRLVVPMQGRYVFQIKDLPMILSVSLLCVYAIALFITLMLHAGRMQRQQERSNSTRKLNPKLGFLGLLGFLGFGGFWTYSVNGTIFPFLFFIFFGFFGFYFDGKMSGTFMDERFRENATRASLKASNISFAIILIVMIILGQGKLFGNLDYTLIAILITVSLILALRIFLAEYLLYRYDYDDRADESEE